MPYLVRPRNSRRLVFVALEIATCPLMSRKTTIHVFEIIFFERPRNRSRIKKCLCACVHLHLTKSHFRSIRDNLESIRKSFFFTRLMTFCVFFSEEVVFFISLNSLYALPCVQMRLETRFRHLEIALALCLCVKNDFAYVFKNVNAPGRAPPGSKTRSKPQFLRHL